MARGRGRGRPNKALEKVVISEESEKIQDTAKNVTPTPYVANLEEEEARPSDQRGFQRKLNLREPLKPDEAELSTVEEEQYNVEMEGSDTQETVKAPWTNLFAKNRAASNGIALNYIAPRIVDGNPIVQLEQESIDREINKWKPALIS
ncbi:hypothetical protein FXO38_04306 [Capsicum annuum]|nr:hypothetical protein FXO38_04306 [Capsicum annuum]